VSSNSHTRLPVISLSTFSGNICDWPHSRHSPLTFDDVHLSNVQRLHNLTSTLQGEAKANIENLPVRNETFKVAGQQLFYQIYTYQLCQFLSVTMDSESNLTSLINHINTHMNALQVLPMNISLQHLLTDHIVLEWLDLQNAQGVGTQHIFFIRYKKSSWIHHLGKQIKCTGTSPHCASTRKSQIYTSY
jgi:Protein of unknown function (DUF1759).